MNSNADSEIPALRNQLFFLLIALIVLSTTLTVYLYRQASQSGKELGAAERIINGYNQGQPAMMNFVNELGAYSMTHADLRPIMAKYGIVPAPTQPGLSGRPPAK